MAFTRSSIAPFRDCLRDLVWGKTFRRAAECGRNLQCSDHVPLLFVERIPQGGSAWRNERSMKALHWRSKRSVCVRCVLNACWSGESGVATARVQFTFEFAEAMPRVAPRFSDPISYEKEFIELGDLKIFRLWLNIHLHHREALKNRSRRSALCFEKGVSL